MPTQSAARRSAHTGHSTSVPAFQGITGTSILRIHVGVDGRKNPELIPDSLAYRHFIRATSSTSVAGTKRRNALLKRAGLTVQDRLAYVEALGDVDAQLNSIRQARRSEGGSLPQSTLTRLFDSENQAFSDAQARIHAGLSVEGAAKLDAHIQDYIKRRIVIFDDPTN